MPAAQKLTDEGLGGLRSLDQTYADRLRDPLGEVGRGIFSRAHGQLSDDAQRRSRGTGARLFELATQSGGRLSAEAIAQAQGERDRGLDEELFSSRNQLAMEQAGMSLTETGKLFDRMADIRKTILGVGQDEKTRALQTIIAGLSGRQGRMTAIANTVMQGFSVAGR